MINFYKRNDQIDQRIFYLAYLIDYDSIVDMGYNEVIDKDDHLHLLILLKKYPFLVDKSPYINKLNDSIASFVGQYQSNSIENKV